MSTLRAGSSEETLLKNLLGFDGARGQLALQLLCLQRMSCKCTMYHEAKYRMLLPVPSAQEIKAQFALSHFIGQFLFKKKT